jgi:hypothetical protein
MGIVGRRPSLIGPSLEDLDVGCGWKAIPRIENSIGLNRYCGKVKRVVIGDENHQIGLAEKPVGNRD